MIIEGTLGVPMWACKMNKVFEPQIKQTRCTLKKIPNNIFFDLRHLQNENEFGFDK